MVSRFFRKESVVSRDCLISPPVVLSKKAPAAFRKNRHGDVVCTLCCFIIVVGFDERVLLKARLCVSVRMFVSNVKFIDSSEPLTTWH